MFFWSKSQSLFNTPRLFRLNYLWFGSHSPSVTRTHQHNTECQMSVARIESLENGSSPKKLRQSLPHVYIYVLLQCVLGRNTTMFYVDLSRLASKSQSASERGKKTCWSSQLSYSITEALFSRNAVATVCLFKGKMALFARARSYIHNARRAGDGGIKNSFLLKTW